MRKSDGDFSQLLDLLAEPDEFDPANMPKGRKYLHSSTKTTLDALLSISVLPITGLPSLAGAAAIKLIDHESPIFKQTRIGHQGEAFTIYKLLTMPGVSADTHSNGRHNDPRRSSLGRLLSLLRIDESPQLLNVARREMSVVGPRPLVKPYFNEVRHLIGSKGADEWIKIRSLALPGIFDDFSNQHHSYAINGDEADQLRTRIAVESEYVLETASLQEDLRVLGNTAVLFFETAFRHVREAL